MEEAVVNRLFDAGGTEGQGEYNEADCLEGKRGQNDVARNPTRLVVYRGHIEFANKLPVTERHAPLGARDIGTREGDDAEAAGLNQAEDYELAVAGELNRVYRDETGDADSRGGREEGVNQSDRAGATICAGQSEEHGAHCDQGDEVTEESPSFVQ